MTGYTSKYILLTMILVLLSTSGCTGELKLIQVMFRHGNRAPAVDVKTYYPLDPYRNHTYYPMGDGGLTNIGKSHVYRLGKYLKRKYENFLGPVYTKDLIRFQADEIERMVMSAQLVAAALFPPTKLQKWTQELKWQPIPVWHEPFEDDLFYNGIFCSNYTRMRNDAETSDEHLINRLRSLRNFFEYMSEHTGSNMTHLNCFLLRQNLYAQMDFGLELPEWTKSVFPDGQLEEVAIYDLIIQSYTTTMRQLLGGQWIGQWLKHVENHLSATSKRKAYMYVAHDINLAAILIVLGNFRNATPPYASAIIFELHERNTHFYMKVIYKYNEEEHTLDIPGCGGIECPLETFKEIMRPIISDDVRQLCGEIQIPDMF